MTKRSLLTVLGTALMAVSGGMAGVLLPPEGAGAQAALGLYARSVALVIGISKYDSGWSVLPNAARDAERVKEALEGQGFAVTLMVDDERDITGRVLREAIRDFLVGVSSRPGTRAVIWYSGHGATVRGEGVLVGAEAPASENLRFLESAVQLREIDSWMRLSAAQHVLAILDSCFAATVFEPRREIRPWMSPEEMVLLPVRQYITSGGADQKVPDESLFAQRLIDALDSDSSPADPNRDGYLTASELGLYLALTVDRETEGRQTPQFGETLDARFDRGNFVFAAHKSDGAIAGQPPAPAEPRILAPIPFRDCDKCPLLVTLPPGSFTTGDGRAAGVVTAPFSIGVYEVTFDEWDLCVVEGGCVHRPDDAGWGRDRHPVMRVSRADALEFTTWLSRRTGRPYRLPSADEWEYAARSGTSSAFWFGDAMEPGRACCENCGTSTPTGTCEIGSFGASPVLPCTGLRPGGANCFGLHDFHGNVWEWLADCPSPEQGASCPLGILRGGSWANPARFSRAASAVVLDAGTRSTAVGFRVARNE